MAVGAVLLVTVEEPQPAPPPSAPAAVALAAPDPAPPPAAQPQTVALTASAARPTVSLPQIRQADLLAVDFTTTSRKAPQGGPATGRVTGAAVNLRGGPGTSFAVVGRAALDDRLVVTGARSGTWIEVLTPFDESKAWIHSRYFDAPDGAAMVRN